MTPLGFFVGWGETGGLKRAPTSPALFYSFYFAFPRGRQPAGGGSF